MAYLIKDGGSGNLSLLWNEDCLKESLWIKCKARYLKQIYKVDFVKKRKEFDRQVQRAKRIHWFQMQTDLLDELDEDSNEFWKTIGKIGISNCQNKKIPIEVISGEGQILNDTNAVLEHWKSEFSA